MPVAKSGVEETRERIYAAAREIYARKGSRGMTTRAVAEQAHVNEATLFRHFGTKQVLISSMLDRFSGATTVPDTLETIDRFDTIEEQLRVLAVSAIDAMRRKADLLKVAMAEELANPEGGTCVWRAPTATRERISAFFRGRIEAGELAGDADWLARAFMSLFFSYVMARTLWLELGEFGEDRAVANLVAIFLNGARAR